MKAPSALSRLVVVTVVGFLGGAVAARLAPRKFSVLAGWDAAAVTFVGWIWLSVGRFTPEETRTLATREDASRVTASVLLLSASVASLVGTSLDPVKANQAHAGGKIALTVDDRRRSSGCSHTGIVKHQQRIVRRPERE